MVLKGSFWIVLEPKLDANKAENADFQSYASEETLLQFLQMLKNIEHC